MQRSTRSSPASVSRHSEIVLPETLDDTTRSAASRVSNVRKCPSLPGLVESTAHHLEEAGKHAPFMSIDTTASRGRVKGYPCTEYALSSTTSSMCMWPS
eukprot:771014-Alexandrium_andersonii.AAC.1